MKKCENKGKIIGAVAIAAGAALIGRIIYDFKRIRALTKEEELAGEPEEAPKAEVTEPEVAPVETEAAPEAPEAPAAEETTEAPAETAESVETAEDAKAE